MNLGSFGIIGVGHRQSELATVSGDFAQTRNGDVLFPGDFVECTSPMRSHGMEAKLGRILMIGSSGSTDLAARSLFELDLDDN